MVWSGLQAQSSQMPSAILFQDSIWLSVVMYFLLIALFQVPLEHLFSNVVRWVLSLFELPVCPVDNDDADGGSTGASLMMMVVMMMMMVMTMMVVVAVQVCLAEDDTIPKHHGPLSRG